MKRYFDTLKYTGSCTHTQPCVEDREDDGVVVDNGGGVAAFIIR